MDSRASSSKAGAGNGEAVPMTGGQERSLGRGGGDDTVMQPAKINDKQAAGGANPIASGGQAVGTGGGGRGADAMFAAGGAAGGSAKKGKIATSTSSSKPPADSEADEDLSQRPRARHSKKRPREEAGDPSATMGRLDGEAFAQSEASSSTHPSARSDGKEACDHRAGGSGDPTPAGEIAQDKHPDTLKPLEDPKLDEVVLQDLATQEIRRVRQKQDDPSPAASSASQATAANRGVANQGGGQENGENTAAVPNGAKPFTENRANGNKAEEPRGEGAGEARGGNLEQSEAGSEPKKVSETPSAVGDAESGAQSGGGGQRGHVTSTGGDAATPDTQASNGVTLSKSTTGAPPPLKAVAAPASAAPAAEPVAVSSSKKDDATATNNTSSFLPKAREEKGVLALESTGVESRRSPEGQARPVATEEENLKGRGSEQEKEKLKDEEEKEEGGGAGTGAEAKATRYPDHALPVARTFFDYDAVSGFEMRMLPEFFTGRSAWKTQEMYVQSRNFMIRSYERMLAADRDGQAYLTGTECRRKLAGDACSTLRIHEFLDRFGLINTRTGGKRPPSYPVLPPSTHLWNPVAIANSPSRERKDTTAARREGEVRQGAAATAARPATGGRAGRWHKDGGGGLARPGYSGSGDMEWRREELVRLMEAAVANPDQWEAVAQQVGGGHTPAACMQRFLNLAVEEALAEERDEQTSVVLSAQAPAALKSAAGASPTMTPLPAAGSAGLGAGPVAAVGVEVGANASTVATPAFSATGQDLSSRSGKSTQPVSSTTREGGASGISAEGVRGDSGGTSASSTDFHRGIGDRAKRPARLGPAAPALMLASALVSNVHPEVLKAAMSAATTTADDVARRLAADAVRGGTTPQDSARGGGSLGDGVLDKTGVMCTASRNDEDVEMRDVQNPAASTTTAAAAAGGQGATRKSLTATANGRTDAISKEAGASVVERENCDAGNKVAGQAARTGAAQAAVLSVAGLQARGLAALEEGRTEALMSDLLEARVRRLEVKLHCFDELDKVLETERQSLEHDRAELVADQARSLLS